MESFFTCLVFVIVAALLVPFILALVHARKIRALEETTQKLVARLTILEAHGGEAIHAPESAAAPTPTPPAPVATKSVPPPLPIAPIPPSVEARVPPFPTAARGETRSSTPAIDWESFLGVKLFAWIGGFVLFLGVVFLVKYSFENNLITPFMRVVIGAVIGSVLIAAGWFTAQRNYRVPGQSLCATGVLVLYAAIFGAHTFYNLISLSVAFALMSLITVAAFYLAVKLDAPVIVVLGLAGGFLTPPLLTTGDHPAPIFTYIGLLNAGIAAVALRKRWDYLYLLAAIPTVLIEFVWAPMESASAVAGFVVFLGLQGQFLAFAYLRQRMEPSEKWSTPAALSLGFASIAYAFWLLGLRELATRPGFFFGFAFLADIGLLALAMLRPNPARIAAAAGTALFALLAAWTAVYLREDLLWWALGAYLLFALIHAGFSAWPQRPDRKPSAENNYVPLLALGLLFLCVWQGETSFAVWAVVLLIDLIAIWIAASSRSVVAIVVALLITLATAGLWILTAPPLEESVVPILIVVGGFGIFFSGAATFLTRKLGFTSANDARSHVPALAAAMPFVLLLMLIAKLPIGAPTAVFTVALLLAIVLLALGILSRTSWIAAIALAFTWAVEYEWHALHFTNSYALIALGWYVAFLLIFTAYPFFSAEERSPLPWAIGALSGFLHFWLIRDLIWSAYPQLRTGLLPALFVIPFAFGVYYLIKRRAIVPASGDARLAWQGGAALFFLSLIFPIQFNREWVTLGWALEGLVLLVLFRVVPNAGLRVVGTGLLSLAFVRLALNPAVLEYHPRAPRKIWNWYLYAYGLTSLCLFAGARCAQSYRESTFARVIPRLLYALGTILVFILLNIEIADYFSIGPTLTFAFSGNFARDMTYSIAWALFALGLLLVGMKRGLRYVRYAGLALLLITLMKLFLHDLGNLSQLYRIGAFIGVALILIVASFVYQRFLAPKPDKS